MARTKRLVKAVDVIWTIPDDLWPVLEAILLEYYPPAKTGRPRGCLRTVLNGILYRMRSGVQWNHLPRVFGSDTTVHDWFQRFAKDGVFERLWAVLIGACEDLDGVSWEWQAADGVMNKARFGGSSSAKTRRIGPNRARNACSSSSRTVVRSARSSPRRTHTTAPFLKA
jgi:transposase